MLIRCILMRPHTISRRIYSRITTLACSLCAVALEWFVYLLYIIFLDSCLHTVVVRFTRLTRTSQAQTEKETRNHDRVLAAGRCWLLLLFVVCCRVAERVLFAVVGCYERRSTLAHCELAPSSQPAQPSRRSPPSLSLPPCLSSASAALPLHSAHSTPLHSTRLRPNSTGPQHSSDWPAAIRVGDFDPTDAHTAPC